MFILPSTAVEGHHLAECWVFTCDGVTCPLGSRRSKRILPRAPCGLSNAPSSESQHLGGIRISAQQISTGHQWSCEVFVKPSARAPKRQSMKSGEDHTPLHLTY